MLIKSKDGEIIDVSAEEAKELVCPAHGFVYAPVKDLVRRGRPLLNTSKNGPDVEVEVTVQGASAGGETA